MRFTRHARKALGAGLIAVFGLATFAGNAKAEMVSVEKIRLTTEIYDAVVDYPPPSWVVGEVNRADISKLSVYSKSHQDLRFAIERIPLGETSATWTKLYVASGIHAGPSSSVPIDAFVKFGLTPMKDACGASEFKTDLLEQNASAVTMLMYCEAYKGIPPGRREMITEGEVALIVFAKYRNTLYMIHHHWRGAPFEVGNEASWPVARSELDMMIERFESIRIAETAPFSGR